MKSNRRSVLIGIGALTVGGGAVFGTGAFSSVEAERTVDVETAGDSDALLSLEDGGSEFVRVDGDDLLEISEDSLNQNATTVAEGAIDVESDGEDVGLYVEVTGDALDFEVDGSSIVGDGNTADLDGTISIDLVFDLEGDNDEEDLPDGVTFVAE